MICACPDFSRIFFRLPALFSYNSCSTSSTVVQVTWLPEVADGHVTPKGFPLEGCAHAQPEVGCAMSSLSGSFHGKWRHQTSRDPEGFP
jgi:hypothetical protein